MHKCVRCGSTYADNDSNILRGCAKCGGIFFYYIKSPESTQQLDAVEKELKKKETTLEKELIKQIEKKKKERKRKKPKRAKRAKKKPKERKVKKEVKKEVVRVGRKRYAIEDIFGIETVRMPKDGVYEINIDALMKKRPVIVLERGKVYFIHLPDVFEKAGKV
jgi:predicted  nucleic acid-binding Zn-ribbon protein